MQQTEMYYSRVLGSQQRVACVEEATTRAPARARARDGMMQLTLLSVVRNFFDFAAHSNPEPRAIFNEIHCAARSHCSRLLRLIPLSD